MFIYLKHSLKFKVLSLILTVFFIITFICPLDIFAQTKVEIPAGKVIAVRTNTVISPDKFRVGNTVYLSAVSDVTIDGNVVIKSGASAKGEVTISKELNYIGIPAKIGIAVRSVQAVDGSTIMVSGSQSIEGKDKMVSSIGLSLVCCILFALMKGGDAIIPSGTQIDCTVSSTVSITIK
jgi:hypothetical protein